MEITIRNKYPGWLAKRKLTSVRNRYVRYIEHNEKPIHDKSGYTWADCHHKADSKLRYRFNDFKMGIIIDNDWMVVIAFIKARLKQQFDYDYAWRIVEYNALEKINKQEFHHIKAPNLIWHHIAVDKAGRANKILKRNDNRRPRTDKYDWPDVICSSKTRIDNREPILINSNELYWQLCLKANIEKFRSRLRWLDWNSCIQRNYYKLRRLLN